MGVDLATTFTGLRLENPFLLSSAPPTESDTNIMRAFDAGLGRRRDEDDRPASGGQRRRAEDEVPARRRRLAAAVDAEAPGHRRSHSSWNWELISDKPLDWWVPRIARIKKAHPDRDPRRVDHGGLGQRPGAGALADAREGVPGRRAPTRSS